MTSYLAAAAEGRANARARTQGKRKRKIVEIRESLAPSNVRWGGWAPRATVPMYEAIGECGHVLIRKYYMPPYKSVGQRVTCEDEACRITEKP
jgi:hypothetical protein